MRIVINADDLGCGKNGNESIFSLMDEHKITSSTLMANGPAFDDAVKKIPNYENCSFGIHLNIHDFHSLTSPEIFYETNIISESGIFKQNIRNIKSTKGIRNAIFNEFSAQIEKILDSGVNLSHIDSHHHIHTIPWVFMILKRLQKKYQIRKVRISRNLYTRPPLKLLIYKKLWNTALRNLYNTKSTDYFTDFSTFLEIPHNKIKTNAIVELMCHPSEASHTKEFNLLKSDWVKEIQNNVELISYNDF